MTINTIEGALIVFKARLRELEEALDTMDRFDSATIFTKGEAFAYKEVIAMMEK